MYPSFRCPDQWPNACFPPISEFQPNVCNRPIADIRDKHDPADMSDYRSPDWRDAKRVHIKALKIVVEPAMVAVFMLAVGVRWCGFFVLLLLAWLPLGRVRLRELLEEWGS